MSSRPLLIAALAAGLMLCGCGKQGPLDRPGPLFGGPADAPAKAGGEGLRPVDTVDRRDRDPREVLPPIETPPAPAR